MATPTDVSVHWAILVGVNFYRNHRCLEGAVRDVRRIKEYLESGQNPVRVRTLTADSPGESDRNSPAGDELSWPTSDNLKLSFREVLDNAKPGDYLYIHYSGHGALTPPTRPPNGNEDTGDVALVLFDNFCGSSLFRGYLLAKWMSKFVDNQINVTLVLDCCFSGSVVRNSYPPDSGIRCIDTTPEQAETHIGTRSAWRDTYALPDWLINPDGYTILSACGPHEVAKELRLGDDKDGRREKYGALSFFLIDALTTLRKHGVVPSHYSLYQQLCVTFHAAWPSQHPMRYGAKNFGFFEKLGSKERGFYSILQENNRLWLMAGRAHGVHLGDEYALYPPYVREDSFMDTSQASARARISVVHGLRSELEERTGSPSHSHKADTGWKAKPLPRMISRNVNVNVQVTADILNGNSKCGAKNDRGDLLQLSAEEDESQPYMFYVARDEGNYQILGSSYQVVLGIPPVSFDNERAIEIIMGYLEHLAAFKYFEGIENHNVNTAFTQSFSLDLLNTASENVSSRAQVKHKDQLTLRINNFSDIPLYIAIFAMGPSWDIQNLLQQSGMEYIVVQPKGSKKKSFIASVPSYFQAQGWLNCEDIIKVFVTVQPTSFEPHILRKIYETEESMRLPSSGLTSSDFLSSLMQFRESDFDDCWVTKNFIIHTASK
ncbi:hypothetical protein MGYG_08598 [Nannizzia gypsea CBS 118893]|uniref:Peptidase C14 caspase domain-containing protein n=1 Tax=Arthroderma gypseum (strain ATCC MYA-4604 / CBS 118893) TaxID=535722 RepID=E4V6F9_ARTGP|nr:hypothetical protein MGYG_08598 [Nannizzia gypsea CBS 118893]EFQ96675.1 hypothetical protein MGYG_08598 [Nannizzia gypsea CBS 118893]